MGFRVGGWRFRFWQNLAVFGTCNPYVLVKLRSSLDSLTTAVKVPLLFFRFFFKSYFVLFLLSIFLCFVFFFVVWYGSVSCFLWGVYVMCDACCVVWCDV